MFSAVWVKGTSLRPDPPDRRQKRWERGGAIRESAESAERRRDRKKPAGTGGMFSRAWLHFGRAALERPFLEHFTAFLDPFDRSFFPLYRPFSRLLLRCSAERGFSLQAGRCGQYKDIASLSFPRFFESRNGNWPRAERRRFPADKGEDFRLCRPFSRAPDGRFLRRRPLLLSPSIPCQRRKIADVGKEEAEIAAAPVPAMEAVG